MQLVNIHSLWALSATHALCLLDLWRPSVTYTVGAFLLYHKFH